MNSSAVSRDSAFDQLDGDIERRDAAFGAGVRRSDLVVSAVAFAAASAAAAIVATGGVASDPTTVATVLVANIAALALGGLLWRRGRPTSFFGNLLLAEGLLVFVSSLVGLCQLGPPSGRDAGRLGSRARGDLAAAELPRLAARTGGPDRDGARARHVPDRRAPADPPGAEGRGGQRDRRLRRGVSRQPRARPRLPAGRRGVPPRRGCAPGDLGSRAAPLPRDELRVGEPRTAPPALSRLRHLRALRPGLRRQRPGLRPRRSRAERHRARDLRGHAHPLPAGVHRGAALRAGLRGRGARVHGAQARRPAVGRGRRTARTACARRSAGPPGLLAAAE